MSESGSRDRIATPLKPFWPWVSTWYPIASNGARGKVSSTDLISCSSTTSGAASDSHAFSAAVRALMPLMLKLAIFMEVSGAARDGISARSGPLRRRRQMASRCGVARAVPRPVVQQEAARDLRRCACGVFGVEHGAVVEIVLQREQHPVRQVAVIRVAATSPPVRAPLRFPTFSRASWHLPFRSRDPHCDHVNSQ